MPPVYVECKLRGVARRTLQHQVGRVFLHSASPHWSMCSAVSTSCMSHTGAMGPITDWPMFSWGTCVHPTHHSAQQIAWNLNRSSTTCLNEAQDFIFQNLLVSCWHLCPGVPPWAEFRAKIVLRIECAVFLVLVALHVWFQVQPSNLKFFFPNPFLPPFFFFFSFSGAWWSACTVWNRWELWTRWTNSFACQYSHVQDLF